MRVLLNQRQVLKPVHFKNNLKFPALCHTLTQKTSSSSSSPYPPHPIPPYPSFSLTHTSPHPLVHSFATHGASLFPRTMQWGLEHGTWNHQSAAGTLLQKAPPPLYFTTHHWRRRAHHVFARLFPQAAPLKHSLNWWGEKLIKYGVVEWLLQH